MLKDDVQLRPHQTNAVDKIVRKDGSLLLSHATGSGKTLTAIAGFEALRNKGLAKNALIVAPASLRHNFAEDGIQKFTKDPFIIFGNQQENLSDDPRFVSTETYAASGKPVNYHIVSYDMFKKEPKKYIDAAKADTVIYDEIHRGKNEASNITQVMKEVRPFHRNFIGLTGSIVSNSPGDIVPLVDALTNGNHSLGSKPVFTSRFMVQNKDGNKQLVNKNVVRGLTAPYIDHVDIEDLHIAAPPKKTMTKIVVPMSKHQEDVYRFMIDQLDPVTKAKIKYGIGKKLKERELSGIYSKLMATRQVSNYMQSANPNITHEESLAESPKMLQLIKDVERHLKEVPDAQIVIGTQFIKAGVEPLLYHLKARGHDPAIFVGKGNLGSNESQRQKSIQDFNAGSKKILIISGAGGEGLNLPNTTKIFMLDGHYNPEVMTQMEARGIRAGGQAHRPENKREVEVSRYVTVPTYRAVDVGLNLMDAISPNTYIRRAFEGDTIFQNPIKRPKGTDEIVAQIAEYKSNINKDVKALWSKKASAIKLVPGMYLSPKEIMTEYLKEFGERIEADAPTDAEGWYDKEQELIYIARYRDIMQAIATKTPLMKITAKGAGYSESDFENGMLKPQSLNRTNLRVGGIAIPLMAAVGGLYGGSIAARIQSPPTKKGLAIGIGTGAVGLAGFTAWQTRKILKDRVYHTVAVSQARRARNLDDIQIRDILRGKVVREEVIKNVDHYL